MEKMLIRKYEEDDLPAMIAIWNEVVEEGRAFPQENTLDLQSGREFFASQSYCGVCLTDNVITALYILHPNNIGRCGHLANASYAVTKNMRGLGIGGPLVQHSLKMAKECGFRILQFNAVTDSNAGARKLYAKLGFHELGVVPGGFRRKSGEWEDIHLFWKEVG